MKPFAAILILVLATLAWRVWVSGDGLMEEKRLREAVATQREANDGLRQRNRELDAEVADLKEGMDAVEERARAELGMKRPDETFYQVIEPAPDDGRD